MTKSNSDFSSKPRYYNEYYQLNSIPEALFLIEAECLETPADTNKKNKSSIKGIMCALGVIITLIVGSTWQLYRSVKVNSASTSSNSSTELSITSLQEQK